MRFYLKDCGLYENGKIRTADIEIDGGRFGISAEFEGGVPVRDGAGMILAPSFCDIHVHLREPGFSYKETMASGTAAAARGGFTTVCAMPNLEPVPDRVEAMLEEISLIARDAHVEVLPFAAITMGEKGRALADLEGLYEYCCGYSDDGKGVQDDALMAEAMARIRSLGGFVSAHTEDERELLPGGAVHDGGVARRFGVPGMPAASEYKQIARDLELVEKTGCRYHICHLSAKESVELIRAAKKRGLPVSCEVTPHHIALSEKDIDADDGRFKMNPPLRGEEDRQAILAGLADGTIDCIATDHAPHSDEEKSRGLAGSAFGVVGLETAFAVCYTHLVKTGVLGAGRLLQLLTDAPRRILGRATAPGWVLLDTECLWTVESEGFLSRGRSTPFEGRQLVGDVMLTSMSDNVKYFNEEWLRG